MRLNCLQKEGATFHYKYTNNEEMDKGTENFFGRLDADTKESKWTDRVQELLSHSQGDINIQHSAKEDETPVAILFAPSGTSSLTQLCSQLNHLATHELAQQELGAFKNHFHAVIFAGPNLMTGTSNATNGQAPLEAPKNNSNKWEAESVDEECARSLWVQHMLKAAVSS